MASAELSRILAGDYLSRYPREAAGYLERLSARESSAVLATVDPTAAAAAFRQLAPAAAMAILAETDPPLGGKLLFGLGPSKAGALLGGLAEGPRERLFAAMTPVEAHELRRLMQYPDETAGRLMDPHCAVFRDGLAVGDALVRLRSTNAGRRLFNLLVVDEDGQLCGTVPLDRAALAKPDVPLRSLVQGPPAMIAPFSTRADIVETMERHGLASMPVVDHDRRPIGVLRLNELLGEVGKELSADIVSVTGASKDETALSSAGFAVRKRLPWLLINLVTAFTAAAVVGVFEDTIARFTALAVLLPVVAGQSGNTGSQALAVVLRGLALHEITLRQWPQAVAKEFAAGVLNGLGVGVATCVGVYLWSGSAGLVLVIGLAMVLSMAIAGVAGAAIPMVLAAARQDPAQSSSIVLTTVTDVVGFLSFLGLATAFSTLL